VGDPAALARVRAVGVHRLAERIVREAVRALGPDARVLPLKGTLLARTHYDHVSERPMGDCDLAVASVSRNEAIARLVRGGFRVLRVEADPHTTVLWSDAAPNIQLDLHTRPLPVGYGAVTSAWLLEGARRDEALFGVPVWVPSDPRLLVHLLGNVARDHVVRAHAHAAEDVARVLERGACEPAAFVEAARGARMSVSSRVALDWVRGVRDSEAVARAYDALTEALTPSQRVLADWRFARLTAWGREPALSWKARALARMAGDAPLDAAKGLLYGLYGLARKGLHARDNLRSSAEQERAGTQGRPGAPPSQG